MSNIARPANHRPYFLSVTAASAVVLIAINAWLSLAHPLSHLPTATLERGEAFNAISAFKNEPVTPEVVLLGSSLVTAPVMQSEAAFLNHPILRLHERRSRVLEKLLAEKLNTSTSVFCLAVNGAMASDVYLLARHLLFAPHPPHAIIYGIAPRDLQDNLMPGVDTSETFKVVAGLEDTPELLLSPNLSFDRKVDVVAGRIASLWRYRADIRTYLVLRMKKLLEATLPYVTFDKYGETLELKPRKHGQFPEEAKGELRAYPGLALDHLPDRQTCIEYTRRYNPISKAQINTQSNYLEKFLQECQKHGVKVLMVSMPLSQTNKLIMPAGFYQQYREDLHKLCLANHVELLDLDKSPFNQVGTFVDTVHLKPAVSPDFLRTLAESFAQSGACVTLLRNKASVQVAGFSHSKGTY